MGKLTTKLTLSAVRNKFSKKPIEQPVIEYIWNGLDHFATEVRVRFDFENYNFIEVMDNGYGIEKRALNDTFSPWDSTTKKSINQKGRNGSGRYSYVKLANRAEWKTRHRREQINYRIYNDTSEIHSFHTADIAQNHSYLSELESGTVVRLTDLRTKLDNFPTNDSVVNAIQNNCSWKLAVAPEISIFLNSKKVEPIEHRREEFKFKSEKDPKVEFKITFLQWSSKPVDESSQSYFVNSDNHLIHKETNKANNKKDFYVSLVVGSSWFDNFKPDYVEEEGMDDLFSGSAKGIKSDVYKELNAFLVELVRDEYYKFLVKNAKQKVQQFRKKGYFPKRNGIDKKYADYLDHKLELVVEDIYISEPSFFTSITSKQGKLIFAILDKLTASEHNEDLINVLEGIIELSEDRVKSLAGILKRTRLDHVVDTVNCLTARLDAVAQLKHLILNHYNEVLETPDLQGIVANNTWLFGEDYTTIGNEEDDFTSIIHKLIKEELEGVDISKESVEEGKGLKGVKRQVDFFLLDTTKRRDYLTKEKYFHCTIIEIKRPSSSLNKSHLRQLEDYVEIVQKHPSFKDNPHLKFDFILIGRKISRDDTHIRTAMEGLRTQNQPGLVRKSEDINAYVYTWEHILNEYELSNSHLIDILSLEKEKLIGLPVDEQVQKLQTN